MNIHNRVSVNVEWRNTSITTILQGRKYKYRKTNICKHSHTVKGSTVIQILSWLNRESPKEKMPFSIFLGITLLDSSPILNSLLISTPVIFDLIMCPLYTYPNILCSSKGCFLAIVSSPLSLYGIEKWPRSVWNQSRLIKSWNIPTSVVYLAPRVLVTYFIYCCCSLPAKTLSVLSFCPEVIADWPWLLEVGSLTFLKVVPLKQVTGNGHMSHWVLRGIQDVIRVIMSKVVG